ncbi:WXG100 family type VII secretion target [Streptomyces meridianus]|uniref:WXG100 family type VII secretion target n=1 Tax=Streptomyces meridianus TaxID=2938945 RepID=A0ABT0X9T3_9ACTN|nr:WXG100 family type VII secretion target [Streptomyces meridianus]MCM2579286.1 WXG100 family type VII secretion target [Streptomyces meridianus]
MAKDIVMAPAEIARWALGEMFGTTDELRRIAGELETLSRQIETLTREIKSAVENLDWHGAAADAFVAHAGQRIKELTVVADELEALGTSIRRLADV